MKDALIAEPMRLDWYLVNEDAASAWLDWTESQNQLILECCSDRLAYYCSKPVRYADIDSVLLDMHRIGVDAYLTTTMFGAHVLTRQYRGRIVTTQRHFSVRCCIMPLQI